jgi:predicted glycogen debranching enzyme
MMDVARGNGMKDSVWPSVQVDRDLERGRMEWLHTNGAGAYASSTIAQLHTRRYHGLLVAALEPPRSRHVILSHMDITLDLGAERIELGTHQFPKVLPTGGFRYLTRFDQDPLPRWTWSLERGQFEQKLGLVRGQNAVVLRFVWQGSEPITLSARPLLALRPFHTLVHEHGSMVQSVELRQGEVRVRPVPSLPRLVFRHSATFIGSPDWWRRFEYLVEQARGLEFFEDLWTPGVFSIPIVPGEPVHIVMGVENAPSDDPAALLAETASAIARSDPGPSASLTVRRLHVAAEDFCAARAQTPGIISGYPWFEVWGRDALVSMPGLYFAKNKIEESRKVLAALIDQMQDGLVPNRIPDETGVPEYHAADVTLWLFEAARTYAEKVGNDDGFLRGALFEALVRAFESSLAGTRHNIHVTEQGLFAASDPGFALTWMDAKVGDWVVTPRAGLPVELQALWARACDTLAGFAAAFGKPDLAARAAQAHERAVVAFRRRFWCDTTGYPFDVISEPEGQGAWSDSTIRPNAVVALAVEPRLFDDHQAASLLSVAERDLLTPAGLRTLAPQGWGYCGRYGGGVSQRDAAYHQGTVWPFLTGFYVRAVRRLRPDNAAERQALIGLVESVAANALAVGQVPELADAQAPHLPGGCIAQAWSVAELLRALAWDLASPP